MITCGIVFTEGIDTQILCWLMDKTNCDGYACRQGQFPSAHLLFKTILNTIKSGEIYIYITECLMDIVYFLILYLLLRILQKYSYNICELF